MIVDGGYSLCHNGLKDNILLLLATIGCVVINHPLHINPSIHPPTHPSIHLSTNPPIHHPSLLRFSSFPQFPRTSSSTHKSSIFFRATPNEMRNILLLLSGCHFQVLQMERTVSSTMMDRSFHVAHELCICWCSWISST